MRLAGGVPGTASGALNAPGPGAPRYPAQRGASNLLAPADELGTAGVPYSLRWFKKAGGHPPLQYKRLVLDSKSAL